MTNTYYYYLSMGDGATSDYLNLNDGVNYGVAWGGLSAAPAARGKLRTVTLTLSIYGATNQALVANIAAIETKLTQARRAAGPQGRANTAGKNVTLGVQLDSNTMVYLDVHRGWLHYDDRALLYVAGHVATGAVLELVCEPFARGVPVAYAVSGTLTNGTGSYLYLANVPGDEDPLTRVVVTDVSAAGHYINTVRLGRLALDGLASTDAVGALSLGGSATISSANTWYTCGTVSQPAGTPQMHGDFHLGVQLTDGETILAQPTNVTATPQLRPNVVQTNSGVLGGAAPSFLQSPTPGNDLLLVLVATAPAPGIGPFSGWTYAGSSGSIGPIIYAWYIHDVSSMAATFPFTNAGAGGWWFVAEMQGMNGVATLTTNFGSSTSASSGNSGSGTGCEWFIAATNSTSITWSGLAAGYAQALQEGSGKSPECVIAYDLANTVAAGSVTLSAAQAWVAAAITFTAPTNTVGLGSYLVGSTYYDVQVAASAGTGGSQVGQASIQQTIYLAGQGTIVVSWSAVTFATGYRVYVNAGSGWYYTTTTATSVTISTMPTTAQSPFNSPGVLQVRAAVQVQGSTTWQYGDAVAITRGGGLPEDLALGVLPLPPVVPQDGTAPPAWTVAVQVMHPTSTGFSVTTGVLWLFPAQEDMTVCAYPGLNLAVQRVWTFDVNRWGDRFSCRLDDGTALQPNSPFRLGPGSNLLFVHLTGASGASDTTNLACTVQVTVTPRYRLLAA